MEKLDSKSYKTISAKWNQVWELYYGAGHSIKNMVNECRVLDADAIRKKYDGDWKEARDYLKTTYGYDAGLWISRLIAKSDRKEENWVPKFEIPSQDVSDDTTSLTLTYMDWNDILQCLRSEMPRLKRLILKGNGDVERKGSITLNKFPLLEFISLSNVPPELFDLSQSVKINRVKIHVETNTIGALLKMFQPSPNILLVFSNPMTEVDGLQYLRKKQVRFEGLTPSEAERLLVNCLL